MNQFNECLIGFVSDGNVVVVVVVFESTATAVGDPEWIDARFGSRFRIRIARIGASAGVGGSSSHVEQAAFHIRQLARGCPGWFNLHHRQRKVGGEGGAREEGSINEIELNASLKEKMKRKPLGKRLDSTGN